MDHSEWCAVVISRMMPMSPLGVKTVSEVAFPLPAYITSRVLGWRLRLNYARDAAIAVLFTG